MQYTHLGRTGLRVSRLCLGTMNFGPETLEAEAFALMDRALGDARAKGHRLVLLVGDEAYYSRVGFKPVPKGRATMPGPVDYSRLLVAELVEGAFADVSGAIRPDWSMAR